MIDWLMALIILQASVPNDWLTMDFRLLSNLASDFNSLGFPNDWLTMDFNSLGFCP